MTTLVDSLWNFIGLKHPSQHKGKVVEVVYHALPPSPVIECCCFFLFLLLFMKVVLFVFPLLGVIN